MHQLRQRQAVRFLDAGQRLQNLPQLGVAPPRRHDHRPQPMIFLLVAGRLGLAAGAKLLVAPTFAANPVGRVAAVGDQARPAGPSAQMRPASDAAAVTASSDRTGSSAAANDCCVKIEQDRRPGHGRRLVDLAVQHARARGRPPVDAIQRIARLVAAHAGDPRRILEQPVRHPHFADRPPRRDVEPCQRNTSGYTSRKLGSLSTR